MTHIPKAEYSRRRKALMAQMEPNSIAILPAAAVAIRNRDVEHVYRQDSDFQYLSGFPEPQAVIVLMPGREHGEYVLFCRERNAERELWDGLRAGQEGAIRDFGADDAFPITDIDDILPGLIEGRDRVYSAMGSNPEFDRHLMDWINVIRSKAHLGAQPPNEFVALDHLLHDMRLYKSAAEVKVMREAARISAQAHIRAMQASRAGLYEYSLEAELDYEFRKGGAKMPAYGSIVAAGRNSCILHYQQNDALLKDGDLVLIDAGCEIDCYASDITRTWPVNGKFSPEQKAIYELVLASQEAAFAEIAPNKHWNQAHEATVRVITTGLVKLGLLQGEVDELIASQAYKAFYMHRAGHWLGMDVHDVGEYKVGGEWRVLEVGMALTVEPGIYIAPDNQNVAKKWRGIGVRIEDDVVVTKSGCEILTRGVPKTVAEIEALMAAKHGHTQHESSQSGNHRWRPGRRQPGVGPAGRSQGAGLEDRPDRAVRPRRQFAAQLRRALVGAVLRLPGRFISGWACGRRSPAAPSRSSRFMCLTVGVSPPRVCRRWKRACRRSGTWWKTPGSASACGSHR